MSMRVCGTARRDIKKWRELAPKCNLFVRESFFKSEHFFNPPTELPSYDTFMAHRFHRNEAFAAVDDRDDWLGTIALCKNEQRIALLAIDEAADFFAVGNALLVRALQALGGARPARLYLVETDNPHLDEYLRLFAAHGFQSTGLAYENGIAHHVCVRPPRTSYSSPPLHIS